jgi:hypothetical protein
MFGAPNNPDRREQDRRRHEAEAIARDEKHEYTVRVRVSPEQLQRERLARLADIHSLPMGQPKDE